MLRVETSKWSRSRSRVWIRKRNKKTAGRGVSQGSWITLEPFSAKGKDSDCPHLKHWSNLPPPRRGLSAVLTEMGLVWVSGDCGFEPLFGNHKFSDWTNLRWMHSEFVQVDLHGWTQLSLVLNGGNWGSIGAGYLCTPVSIKKCNETNGCLA